MGKADWRRSEDCRTWADVRLMVNRSNVAPDLRSG